MASTSHFDEAAAVLPPQYQPRQCSPLWRRLDHDWETRLEAVLRRHRNLAAPNVFFRADDVGAGGCAFQALSRLFQAHRVPLAPAVVPAWLSSARIEQLLAEAPPAEARWGWHQHGWRHVNWQRAGKKAEFGRDRDPARQRQDIVRGRDKLAAIFGDRFVPMFTPPWNRLATTTLQILDELGFRAVSLADRLEVHRQPRPNLVNLRVTLDLHTRKGTDPEADFSALLNELERALNGHEPVGIMLHHQRMNRAALAFLDRLLALLKDPLQAPLPGLVDLLGADSPAQPAAAFEPAHHD